MDYKEKVRLAKEALDSGSYDKETIEYIFPELKESEDKRIREDLIIYLRSILSNKKYGDKFIESWIDWLEKQEQKPAAWSEEDKKMLKWIIGYLENKMLNAPIGEERTACKNAIDWLLEKQGEQKPTDKVEPKFHEGEWINGYYTNYKVLSVNNDGYVVEDVDGNKINILFENEKFHHLWTIQDAKDGDVLHCWIDGDEFILIYNGIKDGYITTYGHLYQKFKSFSEEPTTMFCRTIQGHFTPATKEQRSQLERAMTDAGYTFDFEKKELKKIEQKPADTDNKFIRIRETKPKNIFEFLDRLTTVEQEFLWEHIAKIRELDKEEKNHADKVELKFKVGDTVKDPYGDLYHIAEIIDDSYKTDDGRFILFENQEVYTLFNFTAWSEDDTILIDNCISLIEDIPGTEDEQNWLKSLKDRVQPQPKQKWSEEDETKIKSIIALLKNPAVCTMDGNKGIIDASIKYLKSLKDRIQPQQKQEWSEEDEEHIKSLLERLEGMCKKGATFIRTGFAVSEDEDWLKHLKDRVLQPKQEWSEEDESLRRRCIGAIDMANLSDYTKDSLLNWLKSLSPQNRWKPSDEQMEALHSVIYIKELSYYGGLKDTLLSFYNQLKKLRDE